MDYRETLQEDFEDYTPTSNLNGQGGWTTVLAGSATATAETRMGTTVGKFYDPDAISKNSAKTTLPACTGLASEPSLGYQVDFEVENAATSDIIFALAQPGVAIGTPAACQIAIRYLPSGNKIQYFTGSVWTDTGLTWTASSKKRDRIEITTASTFTIWHDNEQAGPFSNQVAWTNRLDTFHIISISANTAETYIDNIYVNAPRGTFSWRTFDARGSVTKTLSSSYPPVYTGGIGGERNILVPGAGGAIFRAQISTNWVSWSTGVPNAYPIVVTDFAGVVYTSSIITGALHQFSKSTNYGETSFTVKAGTGNNDGVCHGMWLESGANPLYLVSRRNANNSIDIWRYDDTLNSWALQDSEAIVAGSSYNSHTWAFRASGSNNFVILADDNDKLTFFLYAIGGVISEQRAVQAGSDYYHSAGDAYPVLYISDTFWYFTAINNTSGEYELLKTTDGGLTFSVVATDVKYRFIYHENIDSTQSDIINWAFNTDTGAYGEFDTNIDHFLQRRVLGDGAAYIVEVNTSEHNHVLFDQDGSDVDVYTWEVVDATSVFKRTLMKQSATQQKYTFTAYISPDDKALLTNGDIVDFHDAFGTLALRAKLVIPRNPAQRSAYDVLFEGFNAELARSKHHALYTSKNTKQIIQGMIDDEKFSFVYRDSSIDPDGDFTTAYTRLVQDLGTNVALFAREMENALFYMEPDGKIWYIAKSRAVDTNYCWSENSRGITLLESAEIDLARTRSAVTGAWNRGSTDNQQIRRVYVGDAGGERDGVGVIEKTDNQIRNDTECLQMATNRYALYGNSITVVKLQVKNMGFIQPGHTVEFSWDDTRTSIPLGTYYVMEWEWNIGNDVNTIWLVNNIVTEMEYHNAKTTYKEDDDIKSTYSDQTVESSSDGTVVTLNPVGKMQAGTFVWRPSEPSSADFDETDLTDDTAWNDLDLSAIIPAGNARAALMRVLARTSFVGDSIMFRRNGQSNAIQVSDTWSSTANQRVPPMLIAAVDESGITEIKVDRSPTNWMNIDITVLGWWL